MNTTKPDVGEAFEVLKKALQDDLGYAYSWHCNIKFAFFDSFPEVFWLPDDTQKHKICEMAAGNFMKRAFDVHTSDNMLDEENK